ncbi:MAG: selenocysteine synthase [Acidobacteriota bacterium]|nr:selenocysteine synthase [Acidobacteriota bacterium]
MKQIDTRRSLFGLARNWLAAAGALGCTELKGASGKGTAGVSNGASNGVDYYEKLGVTKIINAAGTYTTLTSSTMPPSVQAAVARAAEHPVRLIELQKAAGEYLARKLHTEAAMVTAGAASALTLGTAACLQRANNIGIRDIPAIKPGLKNEVLVQKAHRYGYDQALVMCGIRFVEVETVRDYEAAFGPKTVMAHFFNAAEQGQIGREDWIRVAHEHGIPCFNDAAADVPPIANLWNYTNMGFDLVTFSGGKGIRGPQNAGLLLGRKDLIAAAAANDNPFEGIGRGMKVAKEQIVGMVAAIDWFLGQSDAGMETEFRGRANRIAAQLKDVPTLRTEIVIPPIANNVPHLLIRYDRQRVKLSPIDLAKELRRGTPSIELNPATGNPHGGSAGLPVDENTVVVGVWMLEPGEDLIVARRIREALTKAARA